MDARKLELEQICKLKVWLRDYTEALRKEPANKSLRSHVRTMQQKLQRLAPKYSDLELRLALNGYYEPVEEKDFNSLMASKRAELEKLWMNGNNDLWTTQQKKFDCLREAHGCYMDTRTCALMNVLQEATQVLNLS